MVMAPNATHPLTWTQEGNPDAPITTARAVLTCHQFLIDIAHHAGPGVVDHDHNPGTPTITQIADFDRIDANRDGRRNENIALTAAHSVFHARHNRLIEENKLTILETAAGGDVTFLNEWLLVDVTEVPADRSTLLWDGERMLQAARFVTEMPYQHLVLEEFARRIQANVDPFVFTNTPALRFPDISGGIGQLRPNSAARSR